MKRQRGITLTGMIMACIVLVVVVILGFKVVPVYVEYFAIEKQFKAMSMDPKLRNPTRGMIQSAWAARSTVDNLNSISPDQVEFIREGDQVVFYGEYSVKVPLTKNIGMCFDFKPTSK